MERSPKGLRVFIFKRTVYFFTVYFYFKAIDPNCHSYGFCFSSLFLFFLLVFVFPFVFFVCALYVGFIIWASYLFSAFFLPFSSLLKVAKRQKDCNDKVGKRRQSRYVVSSLAWISVAKVNSWRFVFGSKPPFPSIDVLCLARLTELS